MSYSVLKIIIYYCNFTIQILSQIDSKKQTQKLSHYYVFYDLLLARQIQNLFHFPKRKHVSLQFMGLLCTRKKQENLKRTYTIKLKQRSSVLFRVNPQCYRKIVTSLQLTHKRRFVCSFCCVSVNII